MEKPRALLATFLGLGLSVGLAACTSGALSSNEPDTGRGQDQTNPAASNEPLPDCIVGDWRVTETSYLGDPGGFVRFGDDGRFFVWGPTQSRSDDPEGQGYYHLEPNGDADLGAGEPTIVIDSASGLGCPYFATYTFAYGATCQQLQLLSHYDNCTGARKYLGAFVGLKRVD